MSFALLAAVLYVFLSCGGAVRREGIPFMDSHIHTRHLIDYLTEFPGILVGTVSSFARLPRLGTTREKVCASGTVSLDALRSDVGGARIYLYLKLRLGKRTEHETTISRLLLFDLFYFIAECRPTVDADAGALGPCGPMAHGTCRKSEGGGQLGSIETSRYLFLFTLTTTLTPSSTPLDSYSQNVD